MGKCKLLQGGGTTKITNGKLVEKSAFGSQTIPQNTFVEKITDFPASATMTLDDSYTIWEKFDDNNYLVYRDPYSESSYKFRLIYRQSDGTWKSSATVTLAKDTDITLLPNTVQMMDSNHIIAFEYKKSSYDYDTTYSGNAILFTRNGNSLSIKRYSSIVYRSNSSEMLYCSSTRREDGTVFLIAIDKYSSMRTFVKCSINSNGELVTQSLIDKTPSASRDDKGEPVVYFLSNNRVLLLLSEKYYIFDFNEAMTTYSEIKWGILPNGDIATGEKGDKLMFDNGYIVYRSTGDYSGAKEYFRVIKVNGAKTDITQVSAFEITNVSTHAYSGGLCKINDNTFGGVFNSPSESYIFNLNSDGIITQQPSISIGNYNAYTIGYFLPNILLLTTAGNILKVVEVDIMIANTYVKIADQKIDGIAIKNMKPGELKPVYELSGLKSTNLYNLGDEIYSNIKNTAITEVQNELNR